MLEKLFAIFRGEDPLHRTTGDFTAMVELARSMLLEANEVYWGKPHPPEQRTRLYERDAELNKLERRVRMNVIAHLSGPGASDVPYGLLLMSLVKDVERVGDYAKNLTEIERMTGVPTSQLPEDDVVGELREIARTVDKIANASVEVYASADRDKAQVLTVEGRSVSKRCQQLLPRISQGDYTAAQAAHLTLATRFYKRLLGHYLNLLSSVLMPLHKLDYYDEKSILQE